MGTIVTILLLALCGCSRVQYVPVETVRYDSVYIHNTARDSVYISDSTYTLVKAVSDTIIITQYRELTKYRDRTRNDTIVSTRTDTIRVPYPVEKQLTRWQRWKQDFGGWSTLAVIVTVLVVVGRMVYRIIK